MPCGEHRNPLKGEETGKYAGVTLFYCGRFSSQIRGVVTGRLYPFSRQRPVLQVDPRDLAGLLRTRMFTQVTES